jgi:hypothetical protein
LLLVTTTSCATTIYRLDGEFATEAGRADNDCERKDWLVVAPTRAEIVPEGSKTAVPRDDGYGLYRIGDDDPESIVGLREDLAPYGAPALLDRKAEEVSPYDTKRIVAASLGAAGLVALAVGTVVFVNSFQTVKTGNEEEQVTDGPQAVTGAILAGAGLGLGIAGVAVSPSHEQRSRAHASRYVFFPEDLPEEELLDIVGKHNGNVGDRCQAP